MILMFVMLLSSVSVFSVGVFAAGGWDGKTADIGWYVSDPSAAEFTVDTAEELYGLSIIMAYNEKAVSIKGDKKVYYDDNNKVIFDADKVGEKSVAATGFQNKVVKIGADIDLNNKLFLPLGSSWALQGNLDGQNHTIKNFVVNAEQADHKSASVHSHYYGLIACLSGGNNYVKNLTVKNVTLNVKPDAAVTQSVYIGGLIGDMKQATSWVENCKVDNVIVNLDLTNSGTKSILVGAAVGHIKGDQKENSVVVTDFEFNNSTPDKEFIMAENKLYGLGGSSAAPITPKFSANSSVTEKQPSTGNEGNDNNNDNNDNADTGDMTAFIAAVAVMAAGAAIVATKKKAHR